MKQWLQTNQSDRRTALGSASIDFPYGMISVGIGIGWSHGPDLSCISYRSSTYGPLVETRVPMRMYGQ